MSKPKLRKIGNRYVYNTKQKKQKSHKPLRKQSPTIVRADGTIVKQEYNKMVNEFKHRHDFESIIEMNATIEAYLGRPENIGKKMSIKSLTSRITYDIYQEKGHSISKMLINAGLSPQEAADMAGVTANDILNPTNWKFKKNITTFMGKWEFNFNYEGSIFTHIGD